VSATVVSAALATGPYPTVDLPPPGGESSQPARFPSLAAGSGTGREGTRPGLLVLSDARAERLRT
jgi:hypothetical protein